MSWVAGSLVTNPAADAILADTGALPNGTYSVQILLTAKPAGIEALLQLVNSSGTVTRQKILRDRDPPQLLHFLTIQAAQRIRVVARASLGGGQEVECSLLYRAEPVDSLT